MGWARSSQKKPLLTCSGKSSSGWQPRCCQRSKTSRRGARACLSYLPPPQTQCAAMYMSAGARQGHHRRRACLVLRGIMQAVAGSFTQRSRLLSTGNPLHHSPNLLLSHPQRPCMESWTWAAHGMQQGTLTLHFDAFQTLDLARPCQFGLILAPHGSSSLSCSSRPFLVLASPLSSPLKLSLHSDSESRHPFFEFRCRSSPSAEATSALGSSSACTEYFDGQA